MFHKYFLSLLFSSDHNFTQTFTEDEASSITLYHYTDKKSADLILESGYIKQSTGSGDTAFGDGVYMTSLDMSKPIAKLAENNYDDVGLWKQKIIDGKLEVAFRLVLDSESVEQCDTSRDVYIYKGDLYLSDALSWKIVSRKIK